MLTRRATLLLAAVTLASVAFTIVAIERSPLVDVDEVFIASAAWSLVRHGAGVPTVLPAGPWNVSFPAAYGPVFFWLAAAGIRLFGLSALGVRSVCVAGALAASAVSAWLVRRAGGSRSSAVFAACVIWLAPELGRAATNGRMDTVALAFEIAAVAFVVLPSGTSNRRAAGWGMLAGLCAGLAVLTTPRSMTFLAGLPAAAIVALWTRRRTTLFAVLACGLAAATCIVVWPSLNGSGPLYYFVTVPAAARLDAFNSFTDGRLWALHPVAAAAVAGLAVIAAGVGLGTPPRARDDGRSLLPALCWVGASAIVYVVRVNHTFFREIYFVTPITAVVLAIAAERASAGRATHVLTASCALIAVFFVSLRLIKTVQALETWQDRDPAPVERFFSEHIPRDAVVIGYNDLYFYAIEKQGAHYLVAETEPYDVVFPGSPTIGRPPASALPGIRAQIQGRLLVWPDDDRTPLDAPYQCAAGHRLATWTPAHDENVLDQLPIFRRYAYRLRYPPVTIYQMPAGCPEG